MILWARRHPLPSALFDRVDYRAHALSYAAPTVEMFGCFTETRFRTSALLPGCAAAEARLLHYVSKPDRRAQDIFGHFLRKRKAPLHVLANNRFRESCPTRPGPPHGIYGLELVIDYAYTILPDVDLTVDHLGLESWSRVLLPTSDLLIGDTFSFHVLPEPASLVLPATGAAVILVHGRRRACPRPGSLARS